MRLGLLGGTFDPPHLGHLVIAQCALQTLGLDEVRLLVAGDPWMKEGVSSADVRLALARAAVADHPRIVVDDREVRRDGETVTADTLEDLHAELRGVEVVFLLGADAAASLPSWRRSADARRLARFVAAPRPGTDLDRLPDDVEVLDAPALDLSSTGLRRMVREGRSIRYLVPLAVQRMVETRGLYRR